MYYADSGAWRLASERWVRWANLSLRHPSSMDLIRLHRSELRRSLHGPAWHGPALLEALVDVTPEEAQARPLPGVHSIGELATHSLAWIEEVTRRLRDGIATLPERGDWPDAVAFSHETWSNLLDLVRHTGEVLDQAVAEFAEERLLETVGGPEHDPSLGSGVSYAVMLHGLAQHNAYHGGQISLLKHALRRA